MLQLVVFLVSTPGFLFVHSDLLEYITADDMHADVMYKENFKRKTEVVLTLKDKFAKKSIEEKIEILTNILSKLRTQKTQITYLSRQIVSTPYNSQLKRC